MTAQKTHAEKVQAADQLASDHLAIFNELEERGLGQTKKAQAHYAKATHWLARLNKLEGNA